MMESASKGMEIVSNAKKVYQKYIKTGEMSDEVIKSCLLLAQLDPIYRAGFIDPNLGTIDSEDVQDLKNLIKLVDVNLFKSQKVCLLNPTFGEASVIVGGADADLLLDDVLIDIKTTKFLALNRDNLNQIIGYYFLFLIGGIGQPPEETTINFVCIYYSRYGVLYKIAIKELLEKCDVRKFIDWFKKRAANVS